MVEPLTNAFPKNDRAMRWYRDACERLRERDSVNGEARASLKERVAQERVAKLVGRANGFRIALTRALADESATAESLRAFLRETMEDDAALNSDDE